jgi:hypothetical protein
VNHGSTRKGQVLSTCTRKRAARRQSSPCCPLRPEQLETRVTPSLLGNFELDGNATHRRPGHVGLHDHDAIAAPAIGDAIAAPGVTNAGVLPAAAAVPDGAANQRGLAGVLRDVGPHAPMVVSAASPVPPAVPSVAWGSRRLFGRRVGSGADQAGQSFDSNPAAAPGIGWRQRACDACFADGSWLAEDRDTPLAGPNLGRVPEAASAAALAFLSGSWSARRVETEERRRFAV